MIPDVFKSSDGMEIFAIAGLILFLLLFLAVIIWVFKLDKRSLHQWSNIPLEIGTTAEKEGGHDE